MSPLRGEKLQIRPVSNSNTGVSVGSETGLDALCVVHGDETDRTNLVILQLHGPQGANVLGLLFIKLQQ